MTLENAQPGVEFWFLSGSYDGIDEEAARTAAKKNSEASAFLLWSRMPIIVTQQTEDGRKLFDLYDQRFLDARTAGRFTVTYNEDGQPVEPLGY